MGDSVAPAIKLKDTKFDGTSSVTIQWEEIPPNVSTAQSVEANTALYVALRSRIAPPTALPPTESLPEDASPVDFYFPTHSRNEAPVISFEYDQSISVSYDTINPQIGGVSANSVESVAFWKETPHKWTAPPTTASPAPETISTALFEKYYPSNVRNRAPMIRMKKPAGDWDTSAYLQVGSEFLDLNVEAAKELVIDKTSDLPSPAGSAAVAKYFDEERLHKAPEIVIVKDEKVEISMVEVSEPTSLARIMLSGEGEGEGSSE